ncbi:MAG: hypothetical protein ACXAEU_05180 [Candidatus Hodarchaeales archaeon]
MVVSEQPPGKMGGFFSREGFTKMAILIGGFTPSLVPIQVGFGFNSFKMLIAPLISTLSISWYFGLV